MPPPVNRNSNFNRWNAVTNDKPRTIAQATHLVLSGGKALITPELEEELHRVLAKDMEMGIPNYLVEKRTDVFRFCQDYDFIGLDEAGVDKKLFFGYLKIVQSVLKEIFPESDRTMIVCSAPNKPRESNVKITLIEKRGGAWKEVESKEERRALTKSGYHVIFPHVLVNKEEAIKIRFLLLQVLKDKFGPFEQTKLLNEEETRAERISYDSWDDVLDLTIYKANGLRVLGSSKAAPCKECRKIRRDCTVCHNTRYIDEGRPYTVFAVLDGEGELQEETTADLRRDHFKALQLTTIRTHGEAVTRVVDLPAWFRLQEDLDVCLGKRRRKRGAPSASDMTPDKWGTAGEVHNIRIGSKTELGEVSAVDDPRANIFLNLLRDSVGPVTVTKMIIFPDSKSIWAVVSGGVCANVGRVHSGQDVYYQYTPRKGIVQRCWSSKSGADRKHGPCTGKQAIDFFNERAIKVSKKKQNELFPPIAPFGYVPTEHPEKIREALAISNAPNNCHPNCTAENVHLQQLFETIYLTEKRKVENPFSYFKPETLPNPLQPIAEKNNPSE